MIRRVTAAIAVVGLAFAGGPLHARTLTNAERLTADLVAKVQGGTLRDQDILNVQFSIRLPVREIEREGGMTIADHLATLVGCATTGVLQRDPEDYPNLEPGQDVVEAIFDCSSRDEQPMFVRFIAMFENEKLDYVLVQKGLQVG